MTYSLFVIVIISDAEKRYSKSNMFTIKPMDNPFFDPKNQPDSIYDQSPSDGQEDKPISEQTKKTMKKLLVILISIGLVIGIISSWVIVKLMNKYGLTEKTDQFEKLHE